MDVAIAETLATPEILELLAILRDWSYTGHDKWANTLVAAAHTRDIMRMQQLHVHRRPRRISDFEH